MLTIEIRAKGEVVEKIHVVNIVEPPGEGLSHYVILRPNVSNKDVYHERDDGIIILCQKVLSKLVEMGYWQSTKAGIFE